jgi:hypothetical protein
VADRPLRPATDRRLGGPLPRQQANPPRARPRSEASDATFSINSRRTNGPSGINPSFPGLFRYRGWITHVLLTRSPLSPAPKGWFSLDLHVLSVPPAFVLSQDQTLREDECRPEGRRSITLSSCSKVGTEVPTRLIPLPDRPKPVKLRSRRKRLLLSFQRPSRTNQRRKKGPDSRQRPHDIRILRGIRVC